MILVTGAGGNVGRQVVAALAGERVRAADRSPDKLRARLGDAVDVARLDFSDPQTFAPAARGCDRVFLLRPPAIADVKPTLNRFIDVAREQGVRHVVFLSVAGAERNKLVPHHAVEQHLIARSDDWTILRPGFFAQNCEDAYLRDVVEDDRLYVPAGDGVVAFIDARDIAEVAARALRDPAAHRRRAYTLTGPEAISFAAAAELLSRATGRTIRYQPASILGYARHLRRRGLPPMQIVVQTILHVGLRSGGAARVDPTFEQLCGHRARTFAEYVRDHAARFARVSGP